MTTVLDFNINGTFNCDGLNGTRAVRIGGGLGPGEVGCESCPRFSRCGLSHVSTIALELTDIAAVKLMCKEKGWSFKENQKTYAWYGTYVGDAALPEGLKVEDLGKCSHAIGIPGTTWEIGLVKTATGGYRLAYDYWGNNGAPLQAAIGKDGGVFKQLYGVAKATMIAHRKGYQVQRFTLPNGTVRLKVSGM